MIFKKLLKPKAKDFQLPELLDVLDDGFIQNPYPYYQALRHERPIAPMKNGGFLISRYEDVKSLLDDPRFGCTPSRFSVLNAKNKEKHSVASLASHILPFLDMPTHKAPRRIIAKCFHPHFKSFLPRLHQLAKQMIEPHYGANQTSLIYDIAQPYALQVMIEFLGFSTMEKACVSHQQLKTFSEAFFFLFAPFQNAESLKQANQEIDNFRKVILPVIAEFRSVPNDSFFSKLVETDHEGQFLTDEEIADNCLLLLADGIENIQYAVGALYPLIFAQMDMKQRQQLMKEEKLFRTVISEALRLETPAQFIPRIAQETVTLHDTEIKRGMPIFLALGSANRDEAIFEAADQFQPDREQTHDAFSCRL